MSALFTIVSMTVNSAFICGNWSLQYLGLPHSDAEAAHGHQRPPGPCGSHLATVQESIVAQERGRVAGRELELARRLEVGLGVLQDLRLVGLLS